MEYQDFDADTPTIHVLRAPSIIIYKGTGGAQTVYRRVDEFETNTRPYTNPTASASHWSFFSTTSSNFTLPNLVGPGRVLGNLYEMAGRSLESSIQSVTYKIGLHPLWPSFDETPIFNPFGRIIPGFLKFFVLVQCAASRNINVQLESFASLVCLAKLEILFVKFKYV